MIYFNCIVKDTNEDTNKFLTGYWVSDNKFAKLSDIDDMIMLIDGSEHSGFLIIIIDKIINTNDEFFIKINNIKNNNGFYEFEIEFLSDDEDFIWYNKKFEGILSINNGNLKLFNNNILYANLYKDNKITDILN